MSLCLKAASYGIRLPDGILTSYAPFMVHFRPSPSRLLTLLDPLLPIGILTQCLASYAGTSEKGNEGVSTTAQTGHNSIATKAHNHQPSENGCCCEGDRLLPDVVKDSESDSAQVPHTSIECGLVHSQGNVVGSVGSPSESALSNCRNLPTKEVHDVSSFVASTDDHLMKVAKNPYVSPLMASDEQLSKLPPIDLLVI